MNLPSPSPSPSPSSSPSFIPPSYQYIHNVSVGVGSVCTVSLVRRVSDNLIGILKSINLFGQDDKIRQMALNECKLMESMGNSHPNIVKLYEYSLVSPDLSSSYLHIFMEFVSGGDLGSLLFSIRKNGISLSENFVFGIFIQIANALKFLHKNHILHRDVKTENIFIQWEHREDSLSLSPSPSSLPSLLSSIPMVKLGDFGISKQLSTPSSLSQTTIGTPYNFSPEVCNGIPYGTKSDAFSFGVVTYELLTMRKPFEAKTLSNLIQKIINHPIDTIPPPCPYSFGLKSLCVSLLSKSPSSRLSILDIFSLQFVKNKILEFSKNEKIFQKVNLLGKTIKINKNSEGKIEFPENNKNHKDGSQGENISISSETKQQNEKGKEDQNDNHTDSDSDSDTDYDFIEDNDQHQQEADEFSTSLSPSPSPSPPPWSLLASDEWNEISTQIEKSKNKKNNFLLEKNKSKGTEKEKQKQKSMGKNAQIPIEFSKLDRFSSLSSLPKHRQNTKNSHSLSPSTVQKQWGNDRKSLSPNSQVSSPSFSLSPSPLSVTKEKINPNVNLKLNSANRRSSLPSSSSSSSISPSPHSFFSNSKKSFLSPKAIFSPIPFGLKSERKQKSSSDQKHHIENSSSPSPSLSPQSMVISHLKRLKEIQSGKLKLKLNSQIQRDKMANVKQSSEGKEKELNSQNDLIVEPIAPQVSNFRQFIKQNKTKMKSKIPSPTDGEIPMGNENPKELNSEIQIQIFANSPPLISPSVIPIPNSCPSPLEMKLHDDVHCDVHVDPSSPSSFYDSHENENLSFEVYESNEEIP